MTAYLDEIFCEAHADADPGDYVCLMVSDMEKEWTE